MQHQRRERERGMRGGAEIIGVWQQHKLWPKQMLSNQSELRWVCLSLSLSLCLLYFLPLLSLIFINYRLINKILSAARHSCMWACLSSQAQVGADKRSSSSSNRSPRQVHIKWLLEVVLDCSLYCACVFFCTLRKQCSEKFIIMHWLWSQSGEKAVWNEPKE